MHDICSHKRRSSMKNTAIALVLLSSLPVFAAKVSKPKCEDVVQINDKFTPEYMAVVDGYNKSGKDVGEVDIGGIVTESESVKKECAKNTKISMTTVRKNIAKTLEKKEAKTPESMLSPTKAKCSEFLALDDRLQPVAAYWVAGHSKSGEVKNGEVDEVFLDQPVTTLVEECRSAPTASFYDKTKIWIKKRI